MTKEVDTTKVLREAFRAFAELEQLLGLFPGSTFEQIVREARDNILNEERAAALKEYDALSALIDGADIESIPNKATKEKALEQIVDLAEQAYAVEELLDNTDIELLGGKNTKLQELITQLIEKHDAMRTEIRAAHDLFDQLDIDLLPNIEKPTLSQLIEAALSRGTKISLTGMNGPLALEARMRMGL